MIDQRTRRGCHGWQAPYLPLLCTVSIKIASYGEDDPPSLRPERHGRPNHRSPQWRTPPCIEEVRRSVVHSTNAVSQLQPSLSMYDNLVDISRRVCVHMLTSFYAKRLNHRDAGSDTSYSPRNASCSESHIILRDLLSRCAAVLLGQRVSWSQTGSDSDRLA